MEQKPLTIYRCQTDGELVFPEDFEKHAGHRVVIAGNGSLFEWVKVRYRQLTNRLKRREFYQ